MKRVLAVAVFVGRPPRAGLAASLLPFIAFGVATSLLLVLAAGTNAFFAWHDDVAVSYQVCAVLALVLLVIPFLTLGGSAARLSARRRDDRLSTLRLLGATPGFVRALTVVESTATAAAGAIAGVVAYVAVIPAVSLIHFRGEALGLSHLWLSPLVVIGVVLGVCLLAILSALIGLTGVTVSPLGVRTRVLPARVRRRWLWVGLGVFVTLILVAFLASTISKQDGLAAVVVTTLALGVGLAALNLIGPAFIAVRARRHLKTAKTAERLLAARFVLESPKTAWRQVAGVGLACFVGVVLGSGASLSDIAGSTDGVEPEALLFAKDLKTGVLLVLAFAFLIVASSVGVNQGTDVLDRRALYVSLDRMGMPRRSIERTRTRVVMAPVVTVGLGSIVASGVLVLPLLGITIVTAPVSIAVIAVTLVGGVALVRLGVVATAPVMTKVLAEPDRAL